MDSDLHRRYTGVSNERILDNLRLIAELGTPYYVRIPLIEGINADEANIEATATFLDSLPNHEGLCGVSLLPYHDVGRDKHRRLWSTYNPDGLAMSVPSDETLQRCAEQFSKHGYMVSG
jgi:pyruvate formate lyase activating enzyme